MHFAMLPCAQAEKSGKIIPAVGNEQLSRLKTTLRQFILGHHLNAS